jgi:hypothetical protein
VLSVSDAWSKLWNALVDDLYGSCLLSAAERDCLKAWRAVTIKSAECVRRLRFFARSLELDDMPASNGALQAACMSVLVPVYSEAILPQVPRDWLPAGIGAVDDADLEHKHVHTIETLRFLQCAPAHSKRRHGLYLAVACLKHHAISCTASHRFQLS